ncbi:hypothetical protein ACFQL1_15115 [Halomicroarcula sp. GCM10025709]|uniref:hypothetical protein n=1 Tax=Halomicroarcula sp. GCM10025709 TaxID=3252669 RepID=UPI003616DDFB
MPSEQQAGDRDERLRCPTTRERIGEDPARWLDRELITDADRRRIVLTLIDGMDSIERVRAWKACERRLANPQADDNPRNPLEEPRAKIIHRLEQREAWQSCTANGPSDFPRGHAGRVTAVVRTAVCLPPTFASATQAPLGGSPRGTVPTVSMSTKRARRPRQRRSVSSRPTGVSPNDAVLDDR